MIFLPEVIQTLLILIIINYDKLLINNKLLPDDDTIFSSIEYKYLNTIFPTDSLTYSA